LNGSQNTETQLIWALHDLRTVGCTVCTRCCKQQGRETFLPTKYRI